MSKLLTPRTMMLGDMLVERGVITPEQKAEALTICGETGRRLGEVLVEMGCLEKTEIPKLLAEQAGMKFCRIRKGLVDARVVPLIPRDKAVRYRALPMFKIHDRLTLAIDDPNKVLVLDTVRKLTHCEIKPIVCPAEDILKAIDEAYGEQAEKKIDDLITDFDEGDLELVSLESSAQLEDIAQMAGESPIINLVNQIILKGLKDGASDIHIEPEQKFFRIRFRIDGMMYEIMNQRIDLHAPVISRIKLMANLDIAERRLPQDGRIQLQAQGREIDLRVSTLPGVMGEKIVLRILDKKMGLMSLDDLGFEAETRDALRRLLKKPSGMVMVTGPTGSGKTTTLYAGLAELNSMERNILTIEDPVEYQFEIINQNQVKEEIGLTFARILKATLRQDPDVIMVGEIRDPETAKIAVQAALTGHLVLTTMHTNDAASSITRLLEIGVEPYLLAPSLIGVIGQRLVRVNCPDCSSDYFPSEVELEALGVAEKQGLRLKKGRGCPKCFDSGYRGRVGIYELLTSNPEFQNLLLTDPTLEKIREFQASSDMPTLPSEGKRLVLEGKTTLAEIGRSVALG